jgi:hypothetical protein
VSDVRTERQCISDEMVRLMTLTGIREYNRAQHPLLAAAQDYTPRCPLECGCIGCRVAWAFRAAIVDYVAGEVPPE